MGHEPHHPPAPFMEVPPKEPMNLQRLLVRTALAAFLFALTLGVPGMDAAPDAPATLRPEEAAFALKSFRAVAPAGDNAVYSPLGLSMCLGMALEGADGATRRELLAALGAADEAEVRARALPWLQAAEPELTCANTVGVQRGYPLHPAFVDSLRTHWQAGLVDGVKDGGDNDRLSLTNILHFKAKWSQEFPDTRPEPFTGADGRKSRPDTLYDPEKPADYAQVNGCQALLLPYQNRRLAMLVLLPDAPGDLAAFERSLTAERLASIVAALRPHTVEVHMPAFGFKREMDLMPALGTLGLQNAAGLGAGFSRVGPAARADRLRIGRACQKSWIKVDAEGTEARSETTLTMIGCCAAPAYRPPSALFKADRPFLFFILSRDGGPILFMGRVTRPAEEKTT